VNVVSVLLFLSVRSEYSFVQRRKTNALTTAPVFFFVLLYDRGAVSFNELFLSESSRDEIQGCLKF
jgi:hypothetical protein